MEETGKKEKEKNSEKKSEKKKHKKKRDQLLWDNIINCPSIQIIGIPGEEDKMNEHEKA